MMQRRILSIAAALFLLAAAANWLWWPESTGTLAFFWRGGALLAVARLAYNDVQRLPGWLLLAVPVVLIVAARWPRLLVALIPLLILWAVLRKVLGGR